jgi:hypothetical protein
MTNLTQENDGNKSGEIKKPTQEEGKGRREFIKTAAAVVGGITVAASLPGEAHAQTQAQTGTVYVTTTGPTGHPTALVTVDPGISPASLGALLQNVVTNRGIISAAGLPPCGCKSGLDINIMNNFPEVFSL